MGGGRSPRSAVQAAARRPVGGATEKGAQPQPGDLQSLRSSISSHSSPGESRCLHLTGTARCSIRLQNLPDLSGFCNCQRETEEALTEYLKHFGRGTGGRPLLGSPIMCSKQYPLCYLHIRSKVNGPFSPNTKTLHFKQSRESAILDCLLSSFSQRTN